MRKEALNLRFKMVARYRLLAVWYWATTTLASVGYGDYHAINNSEMLLCSAVFLIGTASFSFIMGNFIDMLIEFKRVTAENVSHEKLAKFFGLLKRFNKGRPLPKEMLNSMEEYFDHYWARDLNYAMKSEEDIRFLSELPKEIKIEVSPPVAGSFNIMAPFIDIQELPFSQFPLQVQLVLPPNQAKTERRHVQALAAKALSVERQGLLIVHDSDSARARAPKV